MAVAAVSSCTKDTMGITEINNPREDKNVAKYGETVTVTFMADGAWTAELVLLDGEGWAEIAQVTGNDKAGKGIVRIRFSSNKQSSERSAELYVTVGSGSRKLVGTFVQDAGDDTSAMSKHLNLMGLNHMNHRLPM